uniref:Pentatricopeptide repeat-containing protein At1g53330 n=1 Tax=Ananas comosus var. bracteatus TaxID=296719 RepID=A0A6V7QJ76_ANACO|nr:unnamed protein product [Ananas comosus var. bracteatus]
MAKLTTISPFRLTSLLRLEKDPSLALTLFLNPNPNRNPAPPSRPPPTKPFRYTARSYDLVVRKLGKARMFPEMESVLDRLLADARVVPDEALFCGVIAFYGRARMATRARRAFDRIPSFRCRRTVRSLNSLLHALLQCGDLGAVRSLLVEFNAGEFAPDACTYNILIHAAAASGSIGNARDLFDEMRERGIKPSVVTFGTLITALCDNSMLHDAFRLKELMLESYNMKPNVYVYTTLIKALCKNTQMGLALKLKEEMLLDKELTLDSAVYSTLIRMLFRAGRKGEVVGILEEMKGKGIEPDTVTYNAMLAGFCEDEKDFEAAFEVLNEMERKKCRADVVSYNTIITGFCKQGRWREARELFEDMPRRECRPDVVTYRILFEGMCGAEEFMEAGRVLDEMVFRGYAPRAENVKTFVEGVVEKCDWVLVESSLWRLSKVNALDLSGWEKAICGVLKDFQQFKLVELVDSLSSD